MPQKLRFLICAAGKSYKSHTGWSKTRNSLRNYCEVQCWNCVINFVLFCYMHCDFVCNNIYELECALCSCSFDFITSCLMFICVCVCVVCMLVFIFKNVKLRCAAVLLHLWWSYTAVINHLTNEPPKKRTGKKCCKYSSLLWPSHSTWVAHQRDKHSNNEQFCWKKSYVLIVCRI